ncbi:MAG TPA: non-heme iron oxygenase ferredoxin subunit, partial [Caldilineaceae bacterium]|nr:non-heme iron oxygenase ferredoxin subunit [Caldilineaceae bacterium]
QLLVDPKVKLDTYPVIIEDGAVYLTLPCETEAMDPVAEKPALAANELPANAVAPGQVRRVQVDGEEVAVYNVDGALYATQEKCTHVGGPLSEGELQGNVITCPWHGSCFDVTNGQVMCGPASKPLATYRVAQAGDRIRVEK